jgi:hypothetical protein
LAVHDPAKVVLDLAVTLALGGDCLADMALLRSELGLYGPVASDATVSRTISALAADAPAALAAIDTARAAGRACAWKLAGAHAPNDGASARTPLIVDLDATLVGSHSEKEQGADPYRLSRCTHKVLTWMTGQRLSYSVGFPLPHNAAQLLELIPAGVWTPAYDAHDEIRDGAWVAELTGLLDMSRWPPGMRVIVRKERPHPGAQLRITDVDGHRVTAFATNTRTGGPATQLPTWSCVTAAGPGVRTGSGSRRTPG